MLKASRRSVFKFLVAMFIVAAGCQQQTPEPTRPTSAPATPAESAAPLPGPIPGTRLTPEYVSAVGRFAYLWGWPMVNIHNRRIIMGKVPEMGYMGGIVPVAPPNQLAMLHDYVSPEERLVACPNQDVVYGFGLLDFSQEPVVVQVPDFGDRFWVYQVVDQRTDSFVQIGKMYGTKPGFYLLTGPGWKGTVPSGIAGVFHAKTTLGVIIPRVFKDDTPEDTQAVQSVIAPIMMYPLSKFTGQQQTKQWSTLPNLPSSSQGDEETKWVDPQTF